MALTGSNGDNETNIQWSKSIDFSLYDENIKEINVENQKKSLEFWIPKDINMPIEPYQLIDLVNATQNQSNLTNNQMFNSFNLTGSNVSIHIQIKPNNNQDKSIGYLALLKFGANPVLTQSKNNINNKYYDMANLFCPKDLKISLNDSFYLLFANMTQVNGFKGYVGFAIREINCFNKSMENIDTIIENILNSNDKMNDNNYWLRIYASGCYYMDPLTKMWSSNGMEILPDSNLTHTHCLSNHLTTFAGGFIVLPNKINFDQVWANASFLQNPLIYSTVIVLICLYILLVIWTRYMDWKDNKKIGITILNVSQSKRIKEKYIYEIIVFTGNRPNAGTKSKVLTKLIIFFYFSKHKI